MRAPFGGLFLWGCIMTTKVDIVSNAFTNLGRKPVADIDPSSAEPIVITASKKYDLLVLNALQGMPWRFATITRNLNKLASDPPIEEFRDAFQLPADYLNMQLTRPAINYRIYENMLYTNSTEMQIDYTAKVDESKFPAYFSLYMEYRLTVDMAMPLTQQITLKQDWDKTAKQQSLEAKYQDSQQQPSNVIIDDRIFVAHFGSSGRGLV